MEPEAKGDIREEEEDDEGNGDNHSKGDPSAPARPGRLTPLDPPVIDVAIPDVSNNNLPKIRLDRMD